MTSSADGTLQRAGGVVATAVGDDLLVLPPGAEAVLRLNSTAGAVWRLLEAPASREELVAELAHAYAAPVEQVRADLAPLLVQLLAQGVLRTGP